MPLDYQMEAEVERVLRLNDMLRDQLGRMENRATKAESDLDIEQQVVHRYQANLNALSLRRVHVAMLQAADAIEQGGLDQRLVGDLRELAKTVRLNS